ncbi:MAG: hypothetical protein Q8R28_16405, partial [Dehalococcoidia bacterium]|nr:hypothetical protein [Dehalococcoidia bacterium]
EFGALERKAEQDQAVSITEFWLVEQSGKSYAVDRAILVNGKIAGQHKTAWDRRPIVIQSVHASVDSDVDFSVGGASGMDVTSTRGLGYNRVLYHAQSVFAPLYHINQTYLQHMSQMMEGIGRNLNPGEESIIDPDSGEDAPGREQRGPGSHDVHGPGRVTKTQDLPTANIAQTVDTFVRLIDAEFNRLAPDVLFGQNNPGDSGYLQIIKTSHAQAVFNETVRGAAAFEKRVFDQFVHQFKRASLQFTVAGWKQKGKGAPQFFPGGDFGVKDLPERPIINVDWLTDYATNDAAKLDQYLAGVGKAFSARQGRANILDDEDPSLTQKLIEQEQYEAMPVIQSIRMLYNLRQDIKAVEDAAKREKKPLVKFDLMKEAQYLKNAYAAAEIQMLGQAQNRLGQPEAQQGMAPSTMPPEMGLNNPDRQAQAKGLVSSFTGGRPRPAQEGG